MAENKTADIAVIKSQVTKASGAAEALDLQSEDDLKKASDLLTKIKTVSKMITAYRDNPVKTAYQAYKQIKEQQESTWGPLASDLDHAEVIIKHKALECKRKIDEKAKEIQDAAAVEAAKIEQQRKAGEISDTKANKKIDKIAERVADAPVVGNVVSGAKGGGMTFKKRRTVDDESGFVNLTTLNNGDLNFLVASGYVVWDKVKARKAALDGAVIPGVKVEEVEELSGKTFRS